MFGKRIDLFTLFGFAVRIDYSWFLLAILITWSLAERAFPHEYPDLSTRTYWLMGAAGALGLFVSVVLHELAHSLVARRFGLQMKGITLFIFGGVAEMEDEPPSPKAEFWVAVAGPLASLAISAACYGLIQSLTLPLPAAGVVTYLALINLILVLFNILPAFPLDGGRVLRSILWRWKSNLRWATRITSSVGSAFGLGFVLLGLLSVLRGDLLGGIWWFLIGMFLRGAAQMSYQQLLLRRVLEGEPVRRFMHTDPITVPRAASVRELVEGYIYRHHHKMYPVMDGERLWGCVTTRQVKELDPEEWERQSVGAIAQPCGTDNSVSPDEDAMHALGRMRQSGVSRLLVVEDGRLMGILSLKDLLEFFSLKLELEVENS